MRVGGTSGSPRVKIVVGQDGGSITAKVADKDGNAVSNSQVVIVPADANTEPAMASQMILTETDQDGVVTHGVLAPGKYLLFSPTQKIDHSVDCGGKLWRARSHAKTVELKANGSIEVQLEPRVLE